jgi:FKBP-type peptidyl-prolyl cis-trans isomerase (trigger factor)
MTAVRYKGLRCCAGDREQLLASLLAANPMEVSQTEVANETEQLRLEVGYLLQYDSLTGAGRREELLARAEHLEDEARDAVRIRTLLRSIIQAEGFTVTDQEVRAEAEAMARRQGLPSELAETIFHAEASSLREELLEEKAIAVLRANSVDVDKDLI